MAESFDVLLNILLNKEAAQATKEGIKEIDAEVKKMGKDKASAGEAFKGISGELDKISRGLDEIAAKRKQRERDERAYIAMLTQEAQLLTKQASQVNFAASKVGAFGTRAVIGGMAIGGGIVAEATAYAKKMGDATKETREFNAELARIAEARGRIDQVFTAQLLPFLKKAADIAGKVAGVVENNPELVALALKGAAVMVGVGVLAKLAASGLKLYADAALITAQGLAMQAAEMQMAASVNQLTAAGMKGGVGTAGGMAGTVGTAGTVIGYALVTAIAAYVGAKAGEFIGNQLGKAIYGDKWQNQTITDALQTFAKIGAIFDAKLIGILEELGIVSEGTTSAFWNFSKSLIGLGDDAQKTAEKIGITAKALDQAAGAYEQLKQANAAEGARFAQQKQQIEARTAAQLQSLYASHSARMASIAAQLNSTLKQIEDEMKAAETAYWNERANIIAQGAANIRQIEQDSQERLRQLREDYQKRAQDLTIKRDARGLTHAKIEYDKQVEEERRRAQEELARAREQTRQQLAELDARHAEEQRRREEDMQRAREQANQQYAEETAAYQAQLTQIENAKAEQLKELEQSHREELDENRRAFTNKLRELGIYLNNDYAMQVDYHNKMLEETKRFLEAQSALYVEQNGGGVPGYASGGYAYPGLIRIEKGQREFVMNSRTTRAAERLAGGRLTQNSIVEAMSGALGRAVQNVSVNIGEGTPLMQVRRLLEDNNRSLALELEGALRSI